MKLAVGNSALAMLTALTIHHLRTAQADLFNKKLWYATRTAIRLSTGTYFDGDFDPDEADLDFISYDLIRSGGETAVVAYVDGNEGGGHGYDNYCMVAFRGRNYDPEQYNECCDEWYDTDCWSNSVDGCYDAIGQDAFQDAVDIRDSTFTTTVTDQDGQTCGSMNDELALGFSSFNWNNMENKISNCLSTCQSDVGNDCRLYIVGHSQGGVNAQMAAMKLHTTSASYNLPYVITFGAPPAYHTSSSGCNSLFSNNDRFINFVNMGGHEETQFDVATSIGIDHNSEHLRKGHLVLLNKDSDWAHDPSIYIKELPTSRPYKHYGSPDYTYSNNDEHREKLKLHMVNKYKDRIENIVEVMEDTNSKPNESNGFDTGNFCTRNWQCESNNCGEVNLTSHDTCCFGVCWKCNRQTHTYNDKCKSA